MLPEGNRRRFSTTRWSLVITAGGSSSGADSALAELCERYWYPVYAFIRRTGSGADDARDLAQAFFVRILEKRFLKHATPDRGRFRSFLLGSLRHFLANEHDSRQALKRGGGHVIVSLAFDDGERSYQLEPADDLTPERVYERRWALAVLDNAMQEVASKHADAGRGLLFKRLTPALTGDESFSYADGSRELQMTEGALRVAVHRMRKDLGAALRATIAETVEHARDIDDELRYLLEVLGRSSGQSV